MLEFTRAEMMVMMSFLCFHGGLCAPRTDHCIFFFSIFYTKWNLGEGKFQVGPFSPILFALFCPDLIKLEFIESCCPFSHFARSLFYLNYSGITQSGGSVFPNFRTTLRVT